MSFIEGTDEDRGLTPCFSRIDSNCERSPSAHIRRISSSGSDILGGTDGLISRFGFRMAGIGMYCYVLLST